MESFILLFFPPRLDFIGVFFEELRGEGKMDAFEAKESSKIMFDEQWGFLFVCSFF